MKKKVKTRQKLKRIWIHKAVWDWFYRVAGCQTSVAPKDRDNYILFLENRRTK